MDTLPVDPLSNYKLIKELRAGGEGKAILMEKDGQKYVCKQRIFENIYEANAGLKEAYSLASIKNENIIAFEEVFLRTVPGDDHIYLCIITEFCSKGDLLDFLFEFTAVHGGLDKTLETSLHLDSNSSTTSTSSATSFTADTIDNTLTSGSISSVGSATEDIKPPQPPVVIINNNNNSSQSTTPPPPAKLEAQLSFQMSLLSQRISEDQRFIVSHAKELIQKVKEKKPCSPSPLPKESSKPTLTVPNNNNNSSEETTSSRSSSLSSISLAPISDTVYIDKSILIDWLTQLCLAVQSLHREHLIHRDIKSENVFIGANDTLKIGDFGLATKASSTTKNEGRVGTYIYSAPEVLNGKSYDRSADIFSLGCVFYELITLKLLVQNRRYFGEEILQDKFDKMKFLSDFPPQHQHLGPLVLKMLDGNSTLRPSIESIIDKLNGTQKLSSKKLTTNFNGIRKQLGKGDVKEASEVLGRALSNDPRFIKLFPPEDPDSKDIISEFMKFTLKVFLKRRGQIWGYYGKDHKLQSVCIWHTPDQKKEIKKADILVGKLKFVTKVGISKCRMAGQTMGAINDLISKENGDKNWFLPYIGTDDQYRGNGVGTYLAEPVLEWADHSGYLCKTLCFSKDSFPFFQRLGFEVDKEIKGGSLPSHIEAIYILKRSPRVISD
ncbi:putative protein serine/threonine kinase [Cavenderia fasciculata]|uniref:non-specific serine/threonine protein kinase n=1 Tax=Cavenderia fasciculata TaxID=261658 RepID=F4PK38_CACFS|nr:putative protein serine/threonine kinase [Cavenderia fasciculata]EGG23962.1 putative protein serine/threonine kinase [Cavenderia fasciculata]|eukprot:XP_004361813.1 putative protein serine/threonine kinase [Cavenderia fasciculata]